MKRRHRFKEKKAELRCLDPRSPSADGLNVAPTAASSAPRAAVTRTHKKIVKKSKRLRDDFLSDAKRSLEQQQPSNAFSLYQIGSCDFYLILEKKYRLESGLRLAAVQDGRLGERLSFEFREEGGFLTLHGFQKSEFCFEKSSHNFDLFF